MGPQSNSWMHIFRTEMWSMYSFWWMNMKVRANTPDSLITMFSKVKNLSFFSELFNKKDLARFVKYQNSKNIKLSIIRYTKALSDFVTLQERRKQ